MLIKENIRQYMLDEDKLDKQYNNVSAIEFNWEKYEFPHYDYVTHHFDDSNIETYYVLRMNYLLPSKKNDRTIKENAGSIWHTMDKNKVEEPLTEDRIKLYLSLFNKLRISAFWDELAAYSEWSHFIKNNEVCIKDYNKFVKNLKLFYDKLEEEKKERKQAAQANKGPTSEDLEEAGL